MGALSRPGPTDPVSGQLYEMTSGGLTHLVRFPVAFRPPALASWASCTRPGLGPSLPPAYRQPQKAWRTLTGFPRSARMRPGWGWVPPVLRGRRCPHGRAQSLAAAYRLPTAGPCHPGTAKPSPGCAINEASARVHWHSPHAQPSPRLWTPDGARALGLSRELRTRPPLEAAAPHVTVGTGPGH